MSRSMQGAGQELIRESENILRRDVRSALDEVGLGNEKGTMDGSGRALNPEVLTEVVWRIVEVAQPEKIIMFGSAARGEMGPNSDLDLLVIVQPGVHRRRLAQAIYRNLIGVGFPVDVVVASSEDVERYGNAIGLVLEPALREGKTVHEHEPVAAR